MVKRQISCLIFVERNAGASAVSASACGVVGLLGSTLTERLSRVLPEGRTERIALSVVAIT